MDKFRKWLNNYEAKILGIETKQNESGRNQARYCITKEQWDIIQDSRKHPNKREFVNTINKLDKNGNVVSSVEKLQSEPIEVPENFELSKISTNKTTGQQWLQYLPKSSPEVINEIDFKSIIKKYVKKSNKLPKSINTGNYLFDRLVYTDVHVGMETNSNGFSLYGGLWNEDVINKNLDIMISHILDNKKSNILFIDDLGDFMDGWDGETVRKGHKLQQNMDNEKAFDIGFAFKVRLIDALSAHYSKIICNNICNDNHAGSFAYVVNKPFKIFSEFKYKHVKVNNIRRFIDHYTIGNNCFILSHGKDGKNLKFGFKPILDAKQSEKIDNYIKEHKLYDYDIEFSKGDSHQKIFDESTSDSFNYYNYPAFSPSSEWVQTNFKKGMSGFEFFNFKECGNKSHHPYKFKWKSTEHNSNNYNI